jgi:hypothetical protein
VLGKNNTIQLGDSRDSEGGTVGRGFEMTESKKTNER